MHIGQRIKALMKDRGVTTAQMADHCEVTPGAVSNWFSTGRITKDNLLKVAARLSVDVTVAEHKEKTRVEVKLCRSRTK